MCFAFLMAVPACHSIVGHYLQGVEPDVCSWLLMFIPTIFFLFDRLSQLFGECCRAFQFDKLAKSIRVAAVTLALGLILGGIELPLLLTSGGEYAIFVILPCVPGFLVSCVAFFALTVLQSCAAYGFWKLDKGFFKTNP